MREGQYCSWSDDSDGCMVTFRGSKTDQYNEGRKRYIGRTGNLRCAVAAFYEWYALTPEYFEDSSDRPMFVMQNGKVLGRIEVQADFRLAARAFDLPEDRIWDALVPCVLRNLALSGWVLP